MKSAINGWQKVKLGDICRITPGYAFKSSDWQTTGIPVVKIKNIGSNRMVDLSDVDCVPSNLLSKKLEKYVLKDRDVLVAMTGATAGKVGKVATEKPLFLNQRVAKIEAIAAHKEFVWSLVSSEDYQNTFFRLADGAAQPNMSGAQIEGVEVLLPPLPTQRKIAAVLSAYDDLIENNVRRIAILEEMAAALYREWFIELRFPGHASVPIAESEQGRVPQGWEIKTLGDLATDERRAANPAQVDADTPYIGLEHIPRKSIALSEWGRAADVSSAKLFFNQGEILFGKIRPYFHKVAVAPVSGVCSTDAIVIVPRAAELFSLVLCCASSEEFVAHAVQTSQGTKMPRANWGVMSRFPVVVPPVPLMQRFNAAVNEMVEQIQKLTAVNANLRATRDLLLPKLVAGEVDVSQLAIAGATEETDETTNGAEDADL